MTMLVAPQVAYQASFLGAMAEYLAEGRLMEHRGARLADPAEFEAYVASLRAEELESTSRPARIVPQTTLWWVAGDEYLGRLSIRHRLTADLLRVGGHIGYEVRPTARKKGHATAMLRAGLPHANRLGIDPALVTCDDTNIASKTVIERNGGEFENQIDGKLRYWVPTAGSDPGSEPGRVADRT